MRDETPPRKPLKERVPAAVNDRNPGGASLRPSSVSKSLRGNADWRLSAQGALGLADKLGESRHIVNGQLGQHLPVDGDAGFLQAVHQKAVGHALGPGSGVDAGDPQPPEISLLSLSVGIGPGKGMKIGLSGSFIDVLFPSPISFSDGKKFLSLSIASATAFDAGHRKSPLSWKLTN